MFLYVDDMLITGDDPMHISFVKKCLSEKFMMSDLASLRYFLGFEVISSPDGYFLSQQKYIQDIRDCDGLTDHLIAETPMELNL